MHDDKRGYHHKSAPNATRTNGAQNNTNRNASVNGARTGNTQSGMRTVGNTTRSTPAYNTQTGAHAVRNPQMARTQNTQAVRTQRTPVKAPKNMRSAPRYEENGFERFGKWVKGTSKWLKSTYAVDESAVAERNAQRLSLVREKGSVDYIFLVLVLLVLAFGTVMVYSASYAYSKMMYDDSYYIITRQIIFVVVGLIFMAIAAKLPPEFYRRMSVPVFIGCLVLLCIVPIPIPGFTMSHNGARRWINLGFTEIQPSEFMKLGLPMMLAWYFDRYYERIVEPAEKIKRYWYGIFSPLFITGIVCVLILIEKHLSGTIIMAAIGAIIIFTSGAILPPIQWMLAAVGGLGAVLAALIAALPHARRRFQIWLNPWLDPQDSGYQTLQGLFAIGSGGLFGEGLGNSYQKHMFVSQPQNDFIFVIVCEELGFIGAVAVIALFALLIWRGLVIAMNAPDVYSQLLVMGIIGKIAIQSVLNIAVVTNSIPNTGISLPFFSYGGSSLVVLLIEMGIVLSISRYSKQKK